MGSVLKRALALSICLILMVTVAPGFAGAPTEEVRSVVDEALRILQDPALKAPAQKQKRRQLVKQVIDRRFDYEEMAKRSLGAQWGKLNAGQRKEFVKLFAELLEASYADKIMKYSDEKVTYTGENLEGEYAEVRTVLLRKNDKIPMNYRLINKSPWMVYDVVIEGVSLVSNYRSQFSQMKSFGEIMQRLKTKVKEMRETEK